MRLSMELTLDGMISALRRRAQEAAHLLADARERDETPTTQPSGRREARDDVSRS